MDSWGIFDPSDARPLGAFEVANEGEVEGNDHLSQCLKVLELYSSHSRVVGEAHL
jgi:hypothetical protein